MKKRFVILYGLLLLLIGCGTDPLNHTEEPLPSFEEFCLVGFSVVVNKDSHLISIVEPIKDTAKPLVVDLLVLNNGSSFFIALDDDPYDPLLGGKVEVGTSLFFDSSGVIRLILLDAQNLIDAIWVIKATFSLPSSSSSVKVSSSSSALPSSSSSVKVSSSSSALPSSSSVKVSSSSSVLPSSSSSVKVSSSSSALPSSSSSIEESSSSSLSASKILSDILIKVNGINHNEVLPNASTKMIPLILGAESELDFVQVARVDFSEGATLSAPLKTNLIFITIGPGLAEYSFKVTAEDGSFDEWKIQASFPIGVNALALSVPNGTVFVNTSSIYIEVPYGTDISNLVLSPLDSAHDYRYGVTLELINENGVLQNYFVKAGYQVPGADFIARNDEFWATSSDAMAKSVTNVGILMKSSANLSFLGGQSTLVSRVVEGSLIGIVGGEKLASGFYYTGEFTGVDCNSMYNADGGYPGLESSDISTLMHFGKPFTARPTAFEVSYSYAHIDGNSQKSLIYVMLVSVDNKVIATGAIMNSASVTNAVEQVELVYGSDSMGLLSGAYPVDPSLSLGDGSEEVAFIHIMFASSAYAHIVSTNYKGKENSSLTLDHLKLIY